jgi:SAM-dependent methyltransferase
MAGSIADIPAGSQDLVIAVAVLEHVPSPTRFLTAVRRILAPGGRLILIQPTQDVASYDIFFVDHLFHFATPHIHAYAAKCGLLPAVSNTGFDFMPNFSGHLFTASAPADGPSWGGAPAMTTCASTLASVTADLAGLERTADRLRHAGTPFGVFGLHEVFALVLAYSRLAEFGIAVGLADDPDNPAYRELGLPLARPEECAAFGVRDIFLTMNRVHYAFASRRLSELGLHAIPVLTEVAA